MPSHRRPPLYPPQFPGVQRKLPPPTMAGGRRRCIRRAAAATTMCTRHRARVCSAPTRMNVNWMHGGGEEAWRRREEMGRRQPLAAPHACWWLHTTHRVRSVGGWMGGVGSQRLPASTHKRMRMHLLARTRLVCVVAPTLRATAAPPRVRTRVVTTGAR
ncbi:hypothetical protein EON68_02345 [archaeon]|nr:MAG: hypothetical protein EON68_02345 [archaeon]